MTTLIPGNVEAVMIMTLIYDTVVFLAISYRIMGYALLADSPRDLIRAFFGGGHLSRLSRELIRGGQQFYL
jgi:hypothetical protein